ncbi:hypothetical protein I350_02053 [Cryptococcus amylolentus CBS 6273]|uniref:Raptor N-terminal CASPase-like domain-containing protein n=1 Tax=Cryptococcus amylolentus CBS 6273 TaxID=1296118 RepID=A0A1E3K9H2_9TREE|nr:hypothetical protein I350_02053 [Cryptococcus amylolentus CBS 6273]
MSSRVPPTTFRGIHESLPRAQTPTLTENSLGSGGSGWVTTASSWSTRNGSPSYNAAGRVYQGRTGRDAFRHEPRLAWAGIRHQVGDAETIEVEQEGNQVSHCSQAVLITCLHLSHWMAIRDIGQYGWTVPSIKDPIGSMVTIMKQYTKQMKDLSKHSDLTCRTAPDPSKIVIQHHLTKARMAAGLNSYVAVIYNGHGIQEPPTEAGELWCYDKDFGECLQSGGPSEYIPILLFDMLTWAGASTCFVWDCPSAGRFIRAAHTEANEIDSQLRAAAAQNPSIAEVHPAIYTRRQIHFAACGAGGAVPRVKGMPDDLFTACLTTPLRIALLFHNLQTFPLTKSDSERSIRKSASYMEALWDNMSQKLKDRLWSELSAILHTIAWQTLEGVDYQKLFGKSGDVVSNLSSGFLLSQRVFAAYNATPESIPAIPSANGHALWTTWDLILDNFFEQLPQYFEDTRHAKDTNWEKELKLVSFMADQLESITAADQNLLFTRAPKSGMIPSLTRLPIICEAAMTSEFRITACAALDACLRVLDVRDLAHAVQGGALDVAAKLLALDDANIKPQVISIWSSLVRHDVCVSSLAQEGLESERLTTVPAVQFFLDALQQQLPLHEENEQSSTLDVAPTIQISAVLAAIANFVAGRSAPRFVLRTLNMSTVMLRTSIDIVRQWGALLVSEVLGCLDRPDDEELVAKLKSDLLEMIDDGNVENRAAGVYALSRWLPVGESWSEDELEKALELSVKLVTQNKVEGSPLVRRELAKVFVKILQSAKGYAAVTLWTHILQEALRDRPANRTKITDSILALGKKLKIDRDDKQRLFHVTGIIKAICSQRFDPDPVVAKLVHQSLRGIILSSLKAQSQQHKGARKSEIWEDIYLAAFPSSGEDNGASWPGDTMNVILRSGDTVAELWEEQRQPSEDLSRPLHDSGERKKNGAKRSKVNHQLFLRSKLALQAHIAQANRKAPGSSLDNAKVKPSSQEDPSSMRHRELEDSLVIGEQQVGLPWKWTMRDITCPDPWSTVTFHSFNSTVMSCNKGHDLFLWDWNSSKKTGQVTLKLPDNEMITSARFVNELHEQNVILAEITNGDIHIFAGSQDSTRIKPIANFRALDMRSPRYMSTADENRRKIETTWYRSSGKLCVGGASNVINVWDCPAERCSQVLNTESEVPVTSLITEPVSGRLLFSGQDDGMVKLYDLRQSSGKAVLYWKADATSHLRSDETTGFKSGAARGIAKMGVILGESKHVSSACYNGMLSVHDIRNLSQPAASVLAHPEGISSASFQPHSGLMSTISILDVSQEHGSPVKHDPEIVKQKPLSQKFQLATALSHLSVRPKSSSSTQTLPSVQPTSLVSTTANWSLHRTALGSCEPVTSETMAFPVQSPDVQAQNYRPYTVMHPLRPFLGIGYGRKCHLRGCGVGEGDCTDSGSYTFLKSQAKYLI